MALIEVKVPDIGDFKEVAVIELLVKPGDTVKPEQSLVTVESDKASMEIPSSAAGVVKELKVKLGDKVKQGSVLVVLEGTASASPSAQAVGSPAPPPRAAQQEGSKAQAAAQAAVPAPAATAPTAPSGPVEVRVPDIGDFKDVAVIELLVKPGDSVKVEQSLLTVESDKASMELPSSVAGVVRELKVMLCDKVNAGDLIAILEAAGAGAQAGSPAPAPAVTAAAAPAPVPAGETGPAQRSLPTAALPPHEPSAPVGNLPHASPSVRKVARELGVPLEQVKGSGPKGRITQEDVQAFTKSVMKGEFAGKAPAGAAAAGSSAGLGLLPWPQVDFTRF